LSADHLAARANKRTYRLTGCDAEREGFHAGSKVVCVLIAVISRCPLQVYELVRCCYVCERRRVSQRKYLHVLLHPRCLYDTRQRPQFQPARTNQSATRQRQDLSDAPSSQAAHWTNHMHLPDTEHDTIAPTHEYTCTHDKPVFCAALLTFSA
jgi:hypothetical protein